MDLIAENPATTFLGFVMRSNKDLYVSAIIPIALISPVIAVIISVKFDLITLDALEEAACASLKNIVIVSNAKPTAVCLPKDVDKNSLRVSEKDLKALRDFPIASVAFILKASQNSEIFALKGSNDFLKASLRSEAFATKSSKKAVLLLCLKPNAEAFLFKIESLKLVSKSNSNNEICLKPYLSLFLVIFSKTPVRLSFILDNKVSFLTPFPVIASFIQLVKSKIFKNGFFADNSFRKNASDADNAIKIGFTNITERRLIKALLPAALPIAP